MMLRHGDHCFPTSDQAASAMLVELRDLGYDLWENAQLSIKEPSMRDGRAICFQDTDDERGARILLFYSPCNYGGTVKNSLTKEEFLERARKGRVMKDIGKYCYDCKSSSEADILIEIAKARPEGTSIAYHEYGRSLALIGTTTVFVVPAPGNCGWGFLSPDCDTVAKDRIMLPTLQDMIKCLMGQPFSETPPPKTFRIGCQRFEFDKQGHFCSSGYMVSNSDLREIIAEGQRLGHLSKTIEHQETK